MRTCATIEKLADGEEVARIVLTETKSDSPRSVPIQPDRARELRSVSVAKTYPKAFRLYRNVKKANKARGFSPKLNVHSFRHSTVTRVLKDSGNLKMAQKFAGHRSINTTLRYAHLEDSDLQEVAKAISQRRGKREKKGEVVPFEPVAKTG